MGVFVACTSLIATNHSEAEMSSDLILNYSTEILIEIWKLYED